MIKGTISRVEKIQQWNRIVLFLLNFIRSEGIKCQKRKMMKKIYMIFFVKNQYKIFFVTVIVCLIVGCYDYGRTCKTLKKDLTVIEYLMLDKKSNIKSANIF